MTCNDDISLPYLPISVDPDKTKPWVVSFTNNKSMVSMVVWGSVRSLFILHLLYFVSFLVLQSSRWGIESCLLYFM